MEWGLTRPRTRRPEKNERTPLFPEPRGGRAGVHFEAPTGYKVYGGARPGAARLSGGVSNSRRTATGQKRVRMTHDNSDNSPPRGGLTVPASGQGIRTRPPGGRRPRQDQFSARTAAAGRRALSGGRLGTGQTSRCLGPPGRAPRPGGVCGRRRGASGAGQSRPPSALTRRRGASRTGRTTPPRPRGRSGACGRRG